MMTDNTRMLSTMAEQICAWQELMMVTDFGCVEWWAEEVGVLVFLTEIWFRHEHELTDDNIGVQW